MADVSYATRDHVYLLGLSAQAFAVVPRPLEKYDANHVETSTGTIRLRDHGLSSLDLIEFDLSVVGSLPFELSMFMQYAPIVVSPHLFRVSGVASFSLIGTGWRVGIDGGRRLDAHLVDATARLNGALTAYATPLKPDPITGLYHAEARGLVARIAARSATSSLQITNAEYRKAVDRLERLEAKDDARLVELRLGEPLNPQPEDQNTIADIGARSGFDMAPTPWRTGTL